MTETRAPSRRKLLIELIAHTPGATISRDPATAISGIAIDSREVMDGDLFVALRGGYFDGHRFVDQARDRGARALLVEETINVDLPQILVANSRAALASVASAYFDHPSNELSVIGVTGTDGKTTTCHLIDEILHVNDQCTGMIGTVSVKIGASAAVHETRQTTPESLETQRYLRLMVEAGAEWAIVEATSHGLALHRLDNVSIDIAAVTNITHEHLEYHRTIDAYRRAKGILFERAAANNGTAVVNLDDAGARQMLTHAEGATLLTYSHRNQTADVGAEAVEFEAQGTRFLLRGRDEKLSCFLPMVGRFNLENALCAAAVGIAAGVPLLTIRGALERASPVPGRMATVNEGQPFSVIVDYAHTPESLSNVLSLVRGLNPSGRVIVVSGSAGERDVEKRPLQGAICARLADLSVFTSEDPRFEDPEQIIAEIAAGAVNAGGVEGGSFVRMTDRRDAIQFALGAATAGDVVLLAGKGHERCMIWGLEKRPWNDESVAREILCEIGYRSAE